MMFGSGAAMGFGWLLLGGAVAVIAFVAGLLLLLTGLGSHDDAGALLAGRLSRGEIDLTEQDRLGAVLEATPRRSWTGTLGGLLVGVSLAGILALGAMTMAGAWPRPGPASAGPGSTSFVAGTLASPRVVRIVAGPALRFYPESVSITAGETITFEVVTMGMTPHEFMVGPAADVAVDKEGTPEVADVGMMQTRSVTYTFDGPGPFSFACHAPGHYEAGMKGTISIVP